MEEEPYKRVERIVTTHDLSWLLDLDRNNQLDLDPPYQRRSVWTPRDRRFFLDTIFRNYPSPAIFLHKSITYDTGQPTYHVVDGKQRISTILLFLNNKITLPLDFGDSNYNGKRWRDFADMPEIKRRLWNYRVTVEELDDLQEALVRDVFERLNKNSSKLTAQELRHARFDGWLITFLEQESLRPVWKKFKISTTAKEKRMTNVQNLAELAAVLVRGDISGFDQLDLDQFFADHDEVENPDLEFDVDEFSEKFSAVTEVLEELEKEANIVSKHAQPFLHFYTLWSYVALNELPYHVLAEVSARYVRFMEAVDAFEIDQSSEAIPEDVKLSDYEKLVAAYKAASVGATTDEPKRRERLQALTHALGADVD
ncbi:DUF262 domain-containing protein [Paenarthrobacter sp. NEAU-H11]|uniref:DUF262 domain-containing protein n=1 Tax=Paenarthrobacter sp. NEAU-H11 TaxID=3423924 RepID=UPI003D35641D